jgi:4-hydroxyacetophenone monooxygenase
MSHQELRIEAHAASEQVDPTEWRPHLEHADLPVLVASLVQVTGDARWLEEPFWSACATFRRTGTITAAIQPVAARVFDAVAGMMERRMRTGEQARSDLPDATLLELFRLVTGDEADPARVPLLRVELGLEPLEQYSDGLRQAASRMSVVVIGAGLSGLCMAAKLKQAGYDVSVLEQNSGYGGVWHDNTYPACGVDTHPYQYDLLSNRYHRWTGAYASRAEICRYIEWLIDKNDLKHVITYGTQVKRAVWYEPSQEWTLDVVDAGNRASTRRTQVLITAVGNLNQPKLPDIPGLDAFQGPAFHTSRWDHGVSLADKRVALIGNGSSGVQAAASIAARARLTVFQRSPAWIMPRRGGTNTGRVDETTQALCRSVPFYERWYRVWIGWELGDKNYSQLVADVNWRGGRSINARNEATRRDLVKYIRAEVGDRPDLITKLVPTYPPYVKRMVVDNGFYRTLAQPNVELVTECITGATASGLVTADGKHHYLDVLIFATGFRGTQFLWPIEVRGKSDRTPGEIAGRDDEARAYLGVVMPDFPNLFSLHGPNSGAGHGGAATFVAECQSHFILTCLNQMLEKRVASVECRVEAYRDYNERLDAGLSRMVWSHEGVNSRFRNATGRIVTNHCWTWQEYWTLTRSLDPNAFIWRPRASFQDGGRARNTAPLSEFSAELRPAWAESRPAARPASGQSTAMPVTTE